MNMTFFERLVRDTTAERLVLLSVPQIRDGLAGAISRETYVAYLTEAYHHVKHTVPLMHAALARLRPDQSPFKEALKEYIAEETGHENWILADIKNSGGDAEAARLGEPRPATEFMIAYAYDYINRLNPLGFFGMVYVLEGTSVALATAGASALAASLNLPPSCFTYLSSHGSLDVEHLGFFERLMGAVDDPRDQDAIIHVAKRIYLLFAELFRAIPHDRSLAHAA
jgi:hypothetical protein